MASILQQAQAITAHSSGISCTVESLLATSEHGEVYRVRSDDRLLALKWYSASAATNDRRAVLDTLIHHPAPSAQFLWPIDLATAEALPGFGWLMPIREPQYRSLSEIVTRQLQPSFRVLAMAGIHLAEAWSRLHIAGLCYSSVCDRHVWLDPSSGSVQLGGCDRIVSVHQAKRLAPSNARFVAPELAQGGMAPSVESDRFSLATLLFCLLTGSYPLTGDEEPRFIFDPDAAGEPNPADSAFGLWINLTQFARELFVKSFTDGLRAPQYGRIRANEWRAAMVRLYDNILYCTGCGADNFYDAERTVDTGRSSACRWCGERLRIPPRLFIGRNVVLLSQHTQLFAHHVDESRLYDFSEPVAIVDRHATEASLWVLKNLSQSKWTCILSDGQSREVLPGRITPLAAGMRIHLGRTLAEIR